MIDLYAPFLAAAVLLALSSLVGLGAVRKIIVMREASHELRRGSASAISALSGWAFIAFWVMATWFVATILGDWQASGDLEGAIERSLLRLQILLEIAAALAESD